METKNKIIVLQNFQNYQKYFQNSTEDIKLFRRPIKERKPESFRRIISFFFFFITQNHHS